MTLLELMKIHGMTPTDIAKKLDISSSQIYQWNNKGISEHNPNFKKLKEIIPEIQPKEILLTKYGKEDQRFRAGRKKKILDIADLKESEHTTTLPSHESTLFPTIHIKNKTT